VTKSSVKRPPNRPTRPAPVLSDTIDEETDYLGPLLSKPVISASRKRIQTQSVQINSDVNNFMNVLLQSSRGVRQPQQNPT
jgi:hypothetical protein